MKRLMHGESRMLVAVLVHAGKTSQASDSKVGMRLQRLHLSDRRGSDLVPHERRAGRTVQELLIDTYPDPASRLLVGYSTSLDAKLTTPCDGWLREQDSRQGVSGLTQVFHRYVS